MHIIIKCIKIIIILTQSSTGWRLVEMKKRCKMQVSNCNTIDVAIANKVKIEDPRKFVMQ